MDRAAYNNIRLKAYYWEKQILRGREDALAQERFIHYQEQLEAAKKVLDAARAEKKAQKAAEAEKKSLEWRKNVRRRASNSTGYDSHTLAAIKRGLDDWKPSSEVAFD